MKKRITTLMALSLGLVLSLASCSENEEAGGTGKVSFLVESQDGITDITKSSVSDYTTLPSGNDFTIVVTDSRDNEVYSGTVQGWDAGKALKIGNYSVKASYGSVTDEGFNKPCFQGEESFSVTGGSTNTVSIGVKLANAAVKVSCTDTFKNYFTDYTFTVKTGNGTSISFPKSETRAAFVDAYTISVEGTLTTQAGKTQSFSKSYSTSLSAATCYTLKFDASNIGSTSISISFDNSTDNVDLGSVELND